MIVTFHYSHTLNFVNYHKRIFSYVLDNVDKFILVSKKQLKEINSILKGNKYDNKIVIIPNGFNPKKFIQIPKKIAREKMGLPNHVFIIINVANLVKHKGHGYLIEAMNIIVNKEKKQDIICLIIGEGPLKSKLEKMIKKYNLEDYVKLVGWVPTYKLMLYLNSADVFILPSLKEGNPTVMFEALGVGLPFIGTKVGGIPEVIFSDDYGILTVPADSKKLAKAILVALKKKWDKEKIMKYGKQYSWENIAKETIKVYENILSK